jgi:hypothetical protein
MIDKVTLWYSTFWRRWIWNCIVRWNVIKFLQWQQQKSTHLYGATSPRRAIPSSTTKTTTISLILWHTDMSLGKDRKTNERTAVARQQPINNRGMVFSARSPKQQLNCNRGIVFSVQPVPRLHNEEQLQLRESLEMPMKRVCSWCEMSASLGVSWSNEWVVRQSPASKDINTEAEEVMALEAITRWQPVKIQQAEKTLVCAVMNWKVCELATVQQLFAVSSCVYKCSVNPISDPNTIQGHTHTHDNLEFDIVIISTSWNLPFKNRTVHHTWMSTITVHTSSDYP